jgi:hypothetical protein
MIVGNGAKLVSQRDGRVDVLEGKRGGLKEKLQDQFDMSASGVERLASRLRPWRKGFLVLAAPALF